jgi:hypothetical protein
MNKLRNTASLFPQTMSLMALDLVCSLLNGTLDNSDYIAWNDWTIVNNKMAGCGRKWSWPKSMQYPDIFVEGMRNATKNLSQDAPI